MAQDTFPLAGIDPQAITLTLADVWYQIDTSRGGYVAQNKSTGVVHYRPTEPGSPATADTLELLASSSTPLTLEPNARSFFLRADVAGAVVKFMPRGRA
jgi:hypothetical protein